MAASSSLATVLAATYNVDVQAVRTAAATLAPLGLADGPPDGSIAQLALPPELMSTLSPIGLESLPGLQQDGIAALPLSGLAGMLRLGEGVTPPIASAVAAAAATPFGTVGAADQLTMLGQDSSLLALPLPAQSGASGNAVHAAQQPQLARGSNKRQRRAN